MWTTIKWRTSLSGGTVLVNPKHQFPKVLLFVVTGYRTGDQWVAPPCLTRLSHNTRYFPHSTSSCYSCNLIPYKRICIKCNTFDEHINLQQRSPLPSGAACTDGCGWESTLPCWKVACPPLREERVSDPRPMERLLKAFRLLGADRYPLY